MNKKIFYFAIVLLMNNTINSSAQWIPQVSGTTNTLYSVSNYGWIVGDNGIALKTTNNGTNWFPTPTGTTNRLLSTFITGYTGSYGWAVGANGTILYRYKDSTWISQISGTTNNLNSVYSIYNGSIIYAVGDFGCILKSTNIGANWVVQNSGTSSNLKSIFGYSPSYVVGNNGTILKTTNGGTNWVVQNSGTTVSLNSVCFNGNTGWVVGNSTVIRKTIDGGTTWYPLIISGLTSNLNCINYSSSTNNILVVGDSGKIYKSTDLGVTWYPRVSGTTSNLFSISGNSTCYAVGTNGTILMSPNSGSTPAPTLIYPTNNATGVSLTPTLDWNDIVGATSYRVRLSLYTDTTSIINQLVTNSQYTVPTGLLSSVTDYVWKVNASDVYETSVWSTQWRFSTMYVGINIISNEIPQSYKLYNNYPNPFNPSTNIKFDMPKSSLAKLKVFDILGKEITLLVNKKLDAGSYRVDWDASQYPSGVYFYRIESESFTDVKRMLLIK